MGIDGRYPSSNSPNGVLQAHGRTHVQREEKRRAVTGGVQHWAIAMDAGKVNVDPVAMSY
jgi:hypothetical protein